MEVEAHNDDAAVCGALWCVGRWPWLRIHEMAFEIRRVIENISETTQLSELIEDPDVIVIMRARRHGGSK